jgi:putative aldouronate transport system substrate-binding protein
MKRILFVFLGIVLAVSAFAGGAGGGSSGKTSRTGDKGSIPLATNKPVLSMFIPGGYAEKVSSLEYKDNAFTKKVVDETGIQLQITATSGADAQERLNIMLNTGDYPDIVFAYGGNVDMDFYAQQGIFIPLDEYDPLSWPGIKRAFELYPAAKDKVVGSDGKMYALPYIDVCNHCVEQNGRIWYYLPWIRDNNRKAPETPAEFADFLRWAKNTDLNKNGKKDEVGLAFCKDNLYNVIAYFAKSFMPFVHANYFGLSLDSGRKITEQYRDNDFRAALAFMASLYKEGLIVEDSFSMTSDQLQALARTEDPVIAVIGAQWLNGVYLQLSDKFLDYFQILPLKTASGQRYGINGDPWSQITAKYFITDKCKDPELAIALYDYFQRDDVLMDAYGPKGVFWDTPDTGAVGADGLPATWKWLVPYGEQPLNSAWENGSPHVWTPRMRTGIQIDDLDTATKYLTTGDKSLKAKVQGNNSYASSIFWEHIAAEAKKIDLPNSVFIPPLLMNSTDNSRVADVNAVLDPFKKQAFVEFITGVRDINNNAHWNAYLAELDRLGSKEMVQIMQKYVK